MRRSSYFVVTVLALVVASSATAQARRTTSPNVSEAARKARAFRQLQVPGSKVSRAVRKLRRLKWYGSLAEASRRARHERKPIVWIQALGNLKGYT